MLNFFSLHFRLRPPILCREVQSKILVIFRDLPWRGSLEIIFSPHIVLHHTFGTSLPLAEHTRHRLRVADGIGQCFLPRSSGLTTWVAAAGGLPFLLVSAHSFMQYSYSFYSTGNFACHNQLREVDMAAVRCTALPAMCVGCFINCSQINGRITY